MLPKQYLWNKYRLLLWIKLYLMLTCVVFEFIVDILINFQSLVAVIKQLCSRFLLFFSIKYFQLRCPTIPWFLAVYYIVVIYIVFISLFFLVSLSWLFFVFSSFRKNDLYSYPSINYVSWPPVMCSVCFWFLCICTNSQHWKKN